MNQIEACRNVILCGAILGGVSFFSAWVHADLQTCRTEADKAVLQCQEAMVKVETLKNGASAKVAAGSAPTGQSDKGINLSGVTASGAAADKQALAFCEPLLAKCAQVCDPAPMAEPEKPDAQKKLISCEAEIQALMGKSAASSASLTGNAGSALATGLAALSGMKPGASSPSESSPTSSAKSNPELPPPTPQPSQSSAPEKAEERPLERARGRGGFDVNCSGESAFVLEACSNQLLAECNGKFKESGKCASFSTRYCSKSTGTDHASSGALKAGQGIGTPYCQAFIGSSFACTAETAQCPTCTRTTPVPGAAVAKECMGDPIFSNPQVALAIAKANTNGAGSPTSFGSGGGMATASTPGAGAASAAITDPTKSMVSSTREGMSVAAGSAGGGYSSGSSSDSYSSGRSFSLSGSPTRKVASGDHSGLAPKITDIEPKIEQNLFAISSQILKLRCQAGRLLHCRSKPK